jgi:hypothetical protein
MNAPRHPSGIVSLVAVLLFAWNAVAQAQENPSSAAAAAPAEAKTEMQKWIEATDAQWQAAFKRDVTDVHEAEARKVMLQYLNLLEEAIGKVSKAGDLKGALALRDEQKRFGDTQSFPEKDDAADTAAGVKEIRTAIRAHLAKVETDTAVRAKALHAKYDQVLAQAQTQLTQRQRLDDALLVQKKRDEVSAAWLAGIPTAPAVAAQPKPAPPLSRPAAAGPITPDARGNLFKNPNFEQGTDGWKLTAWGKTGTMEIDPKESHNGKPSLRVHNPEAQHTLVNQKVTVTPKTRYLFSGWIKTDNMELPKRGQKEGAELMVTGGSRRSVPLAKTNPWTRVSYTIVTLDTETEMVVGMSLGHYGSAAKGTAWFSELSLTELGRNAKQ